MTEEQIVLLEEGEIARITINRPKSLNALNEAVLHELLSICTRLQNQQSLRGVVITGSGEKAFVAGADIAGMSDMNVEQITAYVELGQRVMDSIEALPVPVIAAVDGFALGGGMELALACDLIYATPKSRFGQPEVKLGVIPGFGGTQRLLLRAGIGTTRRLIYTGDMVTAEEAFSLGIIDGVVEAELAEFIDLRMNVIASMGPCAVAEAKKVINCHSHGLLRKGLKEEVDAFIRVFATEDRKEGMKAFLDKRIAEFKGC